MRGSESESNSLASARSSEASWGTHKGTFVKNERERRDMTLFFGVVHNHRSRVAGMGTNLLKSVDNVLLWCSVAVYRR
jgi:hypothetical protein